MAQPKVIVESLEQNHPAPLRVVVDNRVRVVSEARMSDHEMDLLLLEELECVAVLSEN